MNWLKAQFDDPTMASTNKKREIRAIEVISTSPTKFQGRFGSHGPGTKKRARRASLLRHTSIGLVK
jgi:hypothetical protein